MLSEVGLIIAIFTCVVMWTTTTAGLVWWLGKQFESTRHTMYGALAMTKTELTEDIERVVAKLEAYEERLRKIEIEHAAWPAMMHGKT